MNEILIREATIIDSKTILGFVKDLARYEKAEHEVVADVSDIEYSIFGANSSVKAIICEQNNIPIGFAVYFYNYSTWLGQNGLYLEDLYVSPKYRSLGTGKKLLKYLARLAVSNNCGRFEWNVLNWNEPAIKFYESIGAIAKSEWVGYQLSGEALIAFCDTKNA